MCLFALSTYRLRLCIENCLCFVVIQAPVDCCVHVCCESRVLTVLSQQRVEPFVGCLQRDFPCHWLCIFYRRYIVMYLAILLCFTRRRTMRCVSINIARTKIFRVNIHAFIFIYCFSISSLVLICGLLHRTGLSSVL